MNSRSVLICACALLLLRTGSDAAPADWCPDDVAGDSHGQTRATKRQRMRRQPQVRTHHNFATADLPGQQCGCLLWWQKLHTWLMRRLKQLVPVLFCR